MGVGRTTQVTVGSDALSVSTKLRTGDHPTIETLVSNQGQVVFRTAVPIEDLKPIFAHSQDIVRRVEVQHSTILGEIQEGGLEPTPQEQAGPPSGDPQPQVPGLEKKLQRALAYLGKKDFALAERELREILDRDPNFTEAQELLEIVHASGTEKAPPAASRSDRLRAGAEALTRGWKSSAIQNWARGLSAEPSNRIFQLLVLLTTSRSAERRTNYLQELLTMGQQLLASNRSEEAHALLLALQAIEDPENISPQLSGTTIGPTFSSDPSGPPNLKPTDTQPTLKNPPASLLTLMESGTTSRPASPSAGLLVDQSLDEQPEREAALVEASEAEGEAARKHPVPRHSSSRRHFAGGAFWEQLGLPPTIVLGGVGALILVAVGMVFFLGRGKDPGNEQLQKAASLAATGQFDRAIAAYDQILGSGQFEVLAYLGRGRARLAAGREEGLDDLTRAAELAPDSPEILEEMADGLYARGRFVEAATVYSKSISLGKDSANARYRLATSLVQLDRREEAVSHLEAALSLDASHGEARYLYGALLNSIGRFAEAENEIRGARARFDPGADYFVELGLALLGQGKLDGAEEIARNFERYDPGDARAHTLLGEVYLERRRFEAARKELITALQANADQPRAQLALGRVWLAIGRSRGDRGDFAKARQILQDASEIPRGDLLLTLGQISLAEGDAFNAINFFENSIAQGGNRLSARLGLAEARFGTQDFAGAAKELESAELLAPTDPAIALSLGLVHSQMKDFPKAAQEYLKAIHRVGLTKPAGEESGPVVLPMPYVNVSTSFDVNRVIRDAYRRALASDQENKVASALKEIAQSTSFVISRPA